MNNHELKQAIRGIHDWEIGDKAMLKETIQFSSGTYRKRSIVRITRIYNQERLAIQTPLGREAIISKEKLERIT